MGGARWVAGGGGYVSEAAETEGVAEACKVHLPPPDVGLHGEAEAHADHVTEHQREVGELDRVEVAAAARRVAAADLWHTHTHGAQGQ